VKEADDEEQSTESQRRRRPLFEHVVLFVVAVVTVLGALAGIRDFFGLVELGTPVRVAGGLFVVGAAHWVVRSWNAAPRFWMPDPWKAAVAGLLCLLIGVTWAWREALPDRARFDFVVVPHNGAFVLESLAPQPGTEIISGPSYEYGSHLSVVCHTEGGDGKGWFQLPDHNFLAANDLVPEPFEEGQPPTC
jgi:hypothetical protein